jgi:hypothetical protein
MARGWLSVFTAIGLAGAAAAVFAARHYTQGADAVVPRGEQSWKVTMAAAGDLATPDGSVTTSLPPEFRHQKIYDERFQSQELTHRPIKSRKPGRREVVWRRSGIVKSQPVRLVTSFRCVTGVRHPTRAMTHLTHHFDAEPAEGVDIRATPRIESEDKDIARTARELADPDEDAAAQVKAFFDHVAPLEDEPGPVSRSALECLRNGGGDSGGKSRLLVALCRNRGIPARLVSGLILVGGQELTVHHWAEAWVNHQWLPMCPTHHHFGLRQWPRNYLVLQMGDEPIVRSRGAPFQVGFTVQALHGPNGPDEDPSSPAIQAFWRSISLYGLQPAEQHVLRFLLLLPLAALIVSFYRTVVGVMTYGTFGPALLGLAFLDLKALHWGLLIFVVTVLIGWGMRHLLDRYRLLQVPRTSILLTLIVSYLIVVIVVASHYGIAGTQYISLFPLVILTHMVERFWTVETEDGAPASFKTLLGTLLVAVTVSLSLGWDTVSSLLFRFPELLGLVLAAQFLLGRYTGYRLTELYRFTDLLREEPGPGGKA